MAGCLRLTEYSAARAVATREPYELRPHLRTVSRALELCLAGALPNGAQNLMVNIAPRFSKTQTVCNLIEYATGLMPDSEWIYTSYAAELAVAQTEKIRNTMRQPWYQDMFPDALLAKSRDAASKKHFFRTLAGGSVYAAGIDGTITGFGAGKTRGGPGGAVVIDDPIKMSEARQEVARKKVVNSYNGTLKSRRNSSHTPFIFIAQRSGPDDLCGWILKNEPNDWYQLKMPVFDDVLESSIWEARISTQQLIDLKTVDPFTYYSQYQQQPRPEGGSVVQESWLLEYDDLAAVMRRCDLFFITGDTAMKEKESSDYSVFALWGIEGDRKLYLLDQIRGRWAYPTLVENARQFWRDHGHWTNVHRASGMYIEDKVSGTSLIQTLGLEEIPIEAWTPADYGATGDDKVSRMKDASWHAYRGKVVIPNPLIAPWVNEWVDEITGFSADMSHTYDDQCDNFSMAVLIHKSLYA
jgi:predicted phage terminase large subunit-like protein